HHRALLRLPGEIAEAAPEGQIRDVKEAHPGAKVTRPAASRNRKRRTGGWADRPRVSTKPFAATPRSCSWRLAFLPERPGLRGALGRLLHGRNPKPAGLDGSKTPIPGGRAGAP